MSKITKLHFFGTSYTEGGGFEFFDKSKYDYLNKFYGHLAGILPFTREAFSYPGQLQTLLKDTNFKVINHSLSGFGNDRMYREFFKIINDDKFEKNNNYFYFEFSNVGRTEIFHNDINDYIVINHGFASESSQPEFYGFSKDYSNSTDDEKKIYTRDGKLINEFIKKTSSISEDLNYISIKLLSFVNFLLFNDINFYILDKIDYHISPQYFKWIPDKLENNNINFKLKNTKTPMVDDYYGIHGMIGYLNLRIKDDTNNEVSDYHFGYIGNKAISEVIYNHLIDNHLLNTEKIDIKI